MSKSTILGIPFDLMSYDDVFNLIHDWRGKGERHYVCIANPHSVLTCQRDETMKNSTVSARLIVPDGIGIILAACILGYLHSGRITGPTLMIKLCEWGQQFAYRHYFYGGEKTVVETLSDTLSQRYPQLQIAGMYSPPFRDITEEEDNDIVERINATNPDIVWVGLGAPKQEKWMADHCGAIKATAMIGVGAAFDFHSGHIRWAPQWIRKSGLEWAWRLAHEPQRMWRRNVDSPLFLIKVLQKRLSMIFGNR